MRISRAAPSWPVRNANTMNAVRMRPPPANSRAYDAQVPRPTSARSGSIRPVVSTQRSRWASSACRQMRTTPPMPSAIGQNSAPRPKTVSNISTMPTPSAASAIIGPTSAKRRTAPGRRPSRLAASRPGAPCSKRSSVGSTSQSPA